MSSHRLPNYLRTHRKRADLSQDDVAFLLGGHCGAHVSRYEHFRRTPSLRAALAYEAVFDTPVSELFAGEYQEVEREVVKRARRLVRKLDQPTHRQVSPRKVAWLRVIAPAALPPRS